MKNSTFKVIRGGLAITYEYYEVEGLKPVDEMPANVFRVCKSEDGLWYENSTPDGEWVMDNELVRYFAGYADGAIRISKKRADAFIAYLKREV